MKKLPHRVSVRADSAFLFAAIHSECLKAIAHGRMPSPELQVLAEVTLNRMLRTIRSGMLRAGVRGAALEWHEGGTLNIAPVWSEVSKPLANPDNPEAQKARARMEAEFRAAIARVLGDNGKSGG